MTSFKYKSCTLSVRADTPSSTDAVLQEHTQGDVADVKVLEDASLLTMGVVGPLWEGGTEEENIQLERCYRRGLELARKRELTSISMASISVDSKGFPLDRAAYIAVRTSILYLDETPEQPLQSVEYVVPAAQFTEFESIFREVTRTMAGL